MVIKTDFAFLRKQARDKKTLVAINWMEKMFPLVRKGKIIKNKKFFKLQLGKFFFWMRKDGSTSIIDMYLEIFQHHHHMLAKGFDGKKDKIVVDAGANEGYYTIGMKQNNPGLRIVAVEPINGTFKSLKKNVTGNKLKNVDLINAALGEKKGSVIIDYVPEITMISAQDIFEQPRPWLDKKRVRKQKVNVITLPLLCKKLKIDQIDILKIDVEGAEYGILKAAKPMLNVIKKIIIEYHSEKLRKQCISLLKKHGFKLVMTSDEDRCGDIYFVNKKFGK